MNRKIKLGKQQKGFTIIEVLIVLAIAGLIVLIVFLAVPALQRNSRNTQRKNDVAQLSGAIQEYVNNNSGKLPANTTEYRANVLDKINPSIYDKTDTTKFLYTKHGTAPSGTVPSGITNNLTESTSVLTYVKCNGNEPTASGASARAVVILYYVETTGAPQIQCSEV